MKLEYTLNIKDVMSFQENFIENSEEWQKQKKNRYIIIPALMSIICMFDYLWHQRTSFFLLAFFGFLSFIWILHVKRSFIKNILDNFKKALEEGDTVNLFGPKTLEVKNTGLVYTETDSVQTMSWHDITEVRETEDYFFILVSDFSGIIVPKKKTGLSDNEADRLDAILTKHAALKKGDIQCS